MTHEDRSAKTRQSPTAIRLRGVRQHNLKGLDLDLPLGQLVVITGVSGSGKSSLAFDTLYAEGQRRYVETFSPYARQFLDRLDRPQADQIDGIPPAIALDQANPVRTSRSTVGTMTELTDQLKLLFARAARLFCHGCGREVRRDTAASIWAELSARAAEPPARVLIVFRVALPENVSAQSIKDLLAQQGYIHLLDEDESGIAVIQDRLALTTNHRSRGIEAIETALEKGQGRVLVYPLGADREPSGPPWRFSSDLHCPDCDIRYREPTPSLFSFNSAIGACPTCRGFGRTIGIDWDQVISDHSKSLIEGAVRPFQSDSYSGSQEDLIAFANRRGIPVDLPWQDLSEADRRWVIDGEGDWEAGVWYGVRGFFDWLEGRAYKMHVRVLLSRYRAYNPCPTCRGSRLKGDALDWRIGAQGLAQKTLSPTDRFRPDRVAMPAAAWAALPGLHLHDLACLPIHACRAFFEELRLEGAVDQALDLLLTGIRARLRYLDTVGVGYLTLDRQSRTLSGGEVQRINLTTALGTALVNTLFVLDEPSIGLHPRDMDRIIAILQRLRDQGNSLVVVEHDPLVMRAADHLIDLGPGPGERGGHICFQGPPAALLSAPGSLTGDYLSGRLQVAEPPAHRSLAADGPALYVRGAAAHNLKGLNVAIPLGGLVVVTGVSGSGKSTLVHEVLYKALARLKGHPDGTPGTHAGIDGHELIADVSLLDQSSIGRTARSCPASYVGALDAIRRRFAQTPLARERGYTAATFSFNAGDGRCPACGGNGFERVEMQFLSDVYVRCPECDGRRYRAAVLEVRLPASDDTPPPSIADMLEWTVDEALSRLVDEPDLRRALAPLVEVGLGYLRLGQPVPTLSGGEAQRLKLAGHLAKTRRRVGNQLFLLDEPTTGLHFADIAVLLRALRRLLDDGHSLVIIEHNLDVIAAADWLIDLGPEGGDSGGRLVCAGTPEQVAAHPISHTGRALAIRGTEPTAAAQPTDRIAEPASLSLRPSQILIHHAGEHNLKDLTLAIPRDCLTVITGVSGSGKSTLAFDILFAEGQRRYLESLNAYARQFVQPAARADVDAIFGIPPTVAIGQRTSRGGLKSTVATLTEIHHFVRLLFVKLGTQFCPDCHIPIQPQSAAALVSRIQREQRGRRIALMAPLVVARKGIYRELADWAARQGHSWLRVDGERQPTDPWPRLDRFREHTIDLPLAEIDIGPDSEAALRARLEEALRVGKGLVRVVTITDGAWGTETAYSTARACLGCGRAFPELDSRLFSYNSKHGWCPSCFGTGLRLSGFDAELTGEETQWREPAVDLDEPCAECAGRRLRPGALAVRFHGRSIADYGALSVDQAAAAFADLRLSQRETAIAADVLAEIRHRLAFLAEVGLGYLALDRAAPTLSGGEAQRLRLAAQLGSSLQGVCYVLDEPTIGLHARDNLLLLDALDQLARRGNTVVIVEHDEETIRRADHIIDLGPGAGTRGGRLVAEGTYADLLADPRSVTAQYLRARPQRSRPLRAPPSTENWLTIKGAHAHNLKQIDLPIPLGRLVCITGVSGSGKSTLVHEVLMKSLRQLLRAGRTGDGRARRDELSGCNGLTGWQGLSRVLEVDQSPIGLTPRSCPATYVGFWDAIRRLFAATPEARLRGWGAARFSFNTGGGRCPVCEGQGVQRLEMSFLPDVKIPCEACGGRRFTSETCEVQYLGRDIAQVLDMGIDEAAEAFAAHSRVHHALRLLQDVGLGYLTLGQPSPTLSGGEAQRIKLVTELAKARPAAGQTASRPTIYLLDEPTVGLHTADVERLIAVLHRLVDAGHSVVVIEHNLDLIGLADWILDLGPEGGDRGGHLVAAGPPEQVASAGELPTAIALRRHWKPRTGPH